MSGAPAWTREYLDIPFVSGGRDRAGLDCWGLVRLILLERFGARLPSLDGRYAGADRAHAREIAAVAAAEREEGAYLEIDRGCERIGDIALMRLMGQPCHVGLVAAPGWLIHIKKGTGVCLERFVGPGTGAFPIIRFYRPKELT